MWSASRWPSRPCRIRGPARAAEGVNEGHSQRVGGRRGPRVPGAHLHLHWQARGAKNASRPRRPQAPSRSSAWRSLTVRRFGHGCSAWRLPITRTERHRGSPASANAKAASRPDDPAPRRAPRALHALFSPRGHVFCNVAVAEIASTGVVTRGLGQREHGRRVDGAPSQRVGRRRGVVSHDSTRPAWRRRAVRRPRRRTLLAEERPLLEGSALTSMFWTRVGRSAAANVQLRSPGRLPAYFLVRARAMRFKCDSLGRPWTCDDTF